MLNVRPGCSQIAQRYGMSVNRTRSIAACMHLTPQCLCLILEWISGIHNSLQEPMNIPKFTRPVLESWDSFEPWEPSPGPWLS
ncbi:hypothetical protein GDO78_018655 [Eleutherodactylus coqui]|uniref:Uncharacterized protein n=1 Tax=Eleutherodactylus coqui TaxID=57060 RepID=A0A8J6B9S5_ELECQ|nr:hypothetical protein GDO78_018655 [Eleutherodactylus coqui]